MNILGIEAFLAIVETRKLTKAAELLHLSQSTVSQRLKLLEDELDSVLIERKKGHKSITLTPKGEEFVSIAERWISLVRETQIFQSNTFYLSLSIGAVDSLNAYVFPPLFKLLVSHTLPIDLRIRTHQSLEIYQLLERREIDVGFVLREVIQNNIVVEPLFTEKMVLIRLFREDENKEAYHPSELDTKDEFFLNWGPSYQVWHDRWWNPLKRPHVTLDTGSLMISLVENPKHWMIVPLSMANYFMKLGNFKMYNIIEAPPDRVCYKITHRYPNPSNIESLTILNTYLETFKKQFISF